MMVDLWWQANRVDREFWHDVIDIGVRQALSEPTAIEIRLLMPPDGNVAAFALGDEITLRSTDDQLVVTADITDITDHYDASGAHLRHVTALDRLHRLRYRHSTRSFEDAPMDDLVRTVLGGADLSLTAVPNLPSLPWRHQYQANDLAFLVATLHHAGAHLVTTGESAAVVTHTEPAGSITLQLGDSLTELAVSATTEGVANSVSASVWDPGRAEPAHVSADHASADVLPAATASGRDRWLHEPGATSRQSALLAAQTTLNESCLGATVIQGTAVDEPGLQPGVACDFRGLDGVTIARHVAGTVNHRVTSEGFVTTFTTEKPKPRSEPAAHPSVIRGIVAATNDPDDRGRIQLRLPCHGDAITPWIDVLCPGANKDRGFIAIPEVGDNVAAIFPDGDLARGFVLGGSFGRRAMPTKVVRGRKVRRHAWHTSRSQHITLDDGAGSITARNRSGSRLVLGHKEVELHSEADLVIAAPGKTITIRAAAVAFEEQA